MNTFVYKLKVNPNIKVLFFPAFVIVTVILMVVLFSPGFVTRLNQKMDEYRFVQSRDAALSAKLESLRKMSEDSLDPEEITVVAFPNKNPSIWVVSEIRKLSNDYEIKIKDISVEKIKDVEKISSAIVRVEVEAADYPSVLSFLKELIVILPVTSLESVSVEREQKASVEGYAGELSTAFYWADFPTTLPPMNEPLNELTDEDMQILGMISGFRSPNFTDIPPSERRDRPEPFY